jgi:hypothetical protein
MDSDDRTGPVRRGGLGGRTPGGAVPGGGGLTGSSPRTGRRAGGHAGTVGAVPSEMTGSQRLKIAARMESGCPVGRPPPNGAGDGRSC